MGSFPFPVPGQPPTGAPAGAGPSLRPSTLTAMAHRPGTPSLVRWAAAVAAGGVLGALAGAILASVTVLLGKG